MMLDMERFAMTPCPEISGNHGTDGEKWTQWLLEKSFFLDFVFRNPEGKRKGKELADAVVLYDDVLLMIQVKSQHQKAKRDPKQWAKNNIADALKQLKHTRRMLVEKHVTILWNELRGDFELDITKYPNHMGLIILSQNVSPFVAEELVPDLKKEDYPIHVISLKDFSLLVSRLDTAGDFICGLELRQDISPKVQYFVHSEEENIRKMIPHIDEVIGKAFSRDSEDIRSRTCEAFKINLSGQLANLNDKRYGLLVDDIIAHAHDVDPSLPYLNLDTVRQTSLEIATALGFLTRERRIVLGKRMFNCVTKATDKKDHYFCHCQPSLKQVFVFLATSKSRVDRTRFLSHLLNVAQFQFNADRGVGIATEPPGSGRSYDMALHRALPPEELKERLDLKENIFGKAVSLWAK